MTKKIIISLTVGVFLFSNISCAMFAKGAVESIGGLLDGGKYDDYKDSRTDEQERKDREREEEYENYKKTRAFELERIDREKKAERDRKRRERRLRRENKKTKSEITNNDVTVDSTNNSN